MALPQTLADWNDGEVPQSQLQSHQRRAPRGKKDPETHTMTHPPVKCHRCGLRLMDAGEHADAIEEPRRIRKFVNGEEVCNCGRPQPSNAFTSRDQPPDLDCYEGRPARKEP